MHRTSIYIVSNHDIDVNTFPKKKQIFSRAIVSFTCKSYNHYLIKYNALNLETRHFIPRIMSGQPHSSVHKDCAASPLSLTIVAKCENSNRNISPSFMCFFHSKSIDIRIFFVRIPFNLSSGYLLFLKDPLGQKNNTLFLGYFLNHKKSILFPEMI